MTDNILLWTLLICVAYIVWIILFIVVEWRIRCEQSIEDNIYRSMDIGTEELIRRSRFVLARRHSQPLAATEQKEESREENDYIFAPASVSEHPRQIPSEELDSTFGTAPIGEENEPMDIDYPLYAEPLPDIEAEDDEYAEELPLNGKMLARGVSFESMGEAYRHVAHNPPITNEQKRQSGATLLNLKHTDMFEAIVSGSSQREIRVKDLIDTYLADFYRRRSGEDDKSPSSRGVVPSDFDVRQYI